MAWWDRSATNASGRASRSRSGESVYQGLGAEAFEGVAWTAVAEQDPVTGRLVFHPGWERRAQGWVPLDPFLRRP